MESKEEIINRNVRKWSEICEEEVMQAMEEYKNSCLQEAIKRIEESKEEIDQHDESYEASIYFNSALTKAIEILKSQING